MQRAKKRKLRKKQKNNLEENKPKSSLFVQTAVPIKEIVLKNIDVILVLLIVGMLIYLNSLGGKFVSDDIAMVKDLNELTYSEIIKSLHLRNLYKFAFLDIFDKSPLPFQLLSFSLHIFNILLAFIFTYLLFGRKIAFIGTLIFATHPINSEAVNWISASHYLMIFGTCMVVLILYFYFRKTTNKIYLISATIIYLLALTFIQNPWTLYIVLFIPVVDLFFIQQEFTKESFKKMVLAYWPFVGITVFWAGAFYFSAYKSRAADISNAVEQNRIDQNASLFTRVSFSFYRGTELLIFPKNLSLYQEAVGKTQAFYTVLNTTVVVIFASLLVALKKHKIIAGLFLLILLSIFPVYSPQQISWYMSDRYLYAASLFFGIILALVFIKLEKYLKIKNLAMGLTILLVFIYSIRTIVRNNDWRDRKTLWESTIKVYPYSARAHNNMGDVYLQERNFEKAIESFQISAQLEPYNPDPIHNLGSTYLLLKDFEKAEFYLMESLRIRPDLYPAYTKLGVLEIERQNYQKAIEYLTKSYELEPNPAVLETINRTKERMEAQ